MKILLALITIASPLLLFTLRHRPYAYLFDLLAALALLLANLSTGFRLVEIKLMNTELTTHIHEIFNDWIFLTSLGYIATYGVYRLLVTTAKNWKKRTNSDPRT